MEKENNYKIAFVGWNPFQFIQVRDLASAMPNAVFVIEKRANRIDEFSEDILYNQDVPILIWERKNMIKLDDIFDIIICQTEFMHIHMFQKAKIVMLQYGYAKETHNFGVWRALGDLTLTFGDYSSKKISHITPTAVVGNPRYDVWHKDSFHKSAEKKYIDILDKNKSTILYMPTWGELSSVDIYFDAILELSSKYNVLIKLHHNTDILEKTRVDKGNESVHYFGATDDALDLLSISDIVITDYSGAIFDAIYCDKPVVLLDLTSEKLNEIDKIDNYSLEVSERDTLGYRVNTPHDISDVLIKIEDNPKDMLEKQSIIKKRLFKPGSHSIESTKEAISIFMEGGFPLSQMQSYIKTHVHQFYTNKRALNIMKKKKG